MLIADMSAGISRSSRAEMDGDALQRRIDEIVWYHKFDFGKGSAR
jgi:hypothetical protein